jgi:arsenate reductase-like glutaredoxin family protein
VVIKHPHKNQKDARNKSPFIFHRYIYKDMTKTQLKQLIKECLNEIDFNSNTNKNHSKVDNFLNRLDNAIVKNPRMVGGKLIVDLTTQIESITVELILKEIKNK